MENRVEKAKRRSYSIQDMEAAIKDVKTANSGVREAAKTHKVPYTTLRDRLNKRHAGKFGGATILSHAEELELVGWIEYCAKVGQPVTKEQILNAAMKIAQLKGDDGKSFQSSGPSNKWLQLFRDRHPIISMRKPEGLTNAAANVNSRNISIWFNDLIRYLEDEGILQHLMDRPQNILNLDESGIDLNALPKKVFTTKNVRHTYQVESAKHHTRVTVTMTVAADGSILPSQIILPNSFSRMLDVAHAAGEEKSKFVWSQTQNGWQDKSSYFAYLKSIDEAMQAKGVERPYIIYADGYPAHHDLELFKWCKSKGIVYVLFFPNCTQALQPLDFSVFHSLKSRYRKESISYKIETKKTTIDEVDFVKIFSRAIQNGVTADTIKNGFKACGLFPIDRSQVHDERLLGGALTRNDSQAENPQALQVTDSVPEEIENIVSQAESPKDVLKAMTNLMDKYQKLPTRNAMKTMIVTSIQHNLKMLEQIELDSMGQLATEGGNSITESILCLPALQASTIEDILERPKPNERKRKRQLKVTKCGVMSSEKIIEESQKIADERKAVEEEKEDRKRIRIEKKAFRDIALKIKHEQPEKVAEKKKVVGKKKVVRKNAKSN